MAASPNHRTPRRLAKDPQLTVSVEDEGVKAGKEVLEGLRREGARLLQEGLRRRLLQHRRRTHLALGRGGRRVGDPHLRQQTITPPRASLLKRRLFDKHKAHGGERSLRSLLSCFARLFMANSVTRAWEESSPIGQSVSVAPLNREVPGIARDEKDCRNEGHTSV